MITLGVEIMFTGLVEEIGKIEYVRNGRDSCRFKIKADKIFSDLKIGDSVAVNGICLTAVTVENPFFEVDVMHETLNRSSLGEMKKGSCVNLERAMPANGRFGGHIVSGHVDGTGNIESFTKDDIAVIVKISASENLTRYIIEKGSVTLDGVSLTVVSVTDNYFTVSLIPHTAKETILLSKKIGDKINIECDVIGKYVEKLMTTKKSEQKDRITKEFLLENGFF
jgi:riboflavin synthase